MRRMPSPWLAAFGLALSCLTAQAQVPAAPTPTAAPGGVAATVNGQPIQEAAVQRSLERVPPEKRAEVRLDLLQYLIDNLLLEQHLLQLQVAVEKAEVDKRVEDMQAQLKKQGKDLAKLLQEMKITEPELREHIAADLRWEKFTSSQATEKALRDLFDADRTLFDGSMVRARHILLTPAPQNAQAGAAAQADLQAVRKQVETKVAEGLARLPQTADDLARAKARASLTDEAFAAAAREKSACPSKAQGGDVGWFLRAGVMVEPFARTAFALQPYQMSDVVPTQFGYHLILVTDRKTGREPKFEDVKEEVKEVFNDRLRTQLAAQLRQRSKIEVFPAAKP